MRILGFAFRGHAAVDLWGLDGELLRIGHRENNGLIAVLLDLLCICHGLRIYFRSRTCANIHKRTACQCTN